MKFARAGLLAFSILLWLTVVTFYVWALWQSWRAMHRPLPPPPNQWKAPREGCELKLPEVDMRNARELPPLQKEHA